MPFQPAKMTPAQLAAVSFSPAIPDPTYHPYSYQLRQWFAWCESNGIVALIGVERAHVELYLRTLTESGLHASSVVAPMAWGSRVLQVRLHRRTHAPPSGLRPTARGAS